MKINEFIKYEECAWNWSLRGQLIWFMFLDYCLVDLLQKEDEPPPTSGQRVLCRHPFTESKRAYVVPSRVELLYKVSKFIFPKF